MSVAQAARWQGLRERRRELASSLAGAGGAALLLGAGYAGLAHRFQAGGVQAISRALPLFNEQHLLGLASRVVSPSVPACQQMRVAIVAGNYLWVIAVFMAALGLAAGVVGGLKLRGYGGSWSAGLTGLLAFALTVTVIAELLAPLRVRAEIAEHIDLGAGVDAARAQLLINDIGDQAGPAAVRDLKTRGQSLLDTLLNYERSSPHIYEGIQLELESAGAEGAAACTAAPPRFSSWPDL
ncbi:MAG: hypothetical protein JOZ39_12230 [Chloroflexi bacterium]|nr:hypothetical protein [Chloroflexota bacterium]